MTSIKLFQMIRLKREGKEKDDINNTIEINSLHTYIENFLKNDDEIKELKETYGSKKRVTDNQLQEEIWKIIEVK